MLEFCENSMHLQINIYHELWIVYSCHILNFLLPVAAFVTTPDGPSEVAARGAPFWSVGAWAAERGASRLALWAIRTFFAGGSFSNALFGLLSTAPDSTVSADL